ncbi:MAG: histidine phosphatase family protein [Acidimicrobiaceae bacterium]|nr:histidine phosphatase family protein [Acidimicrobiaceae bacterium]MBR81391.1 histidine phosphatase family protein [Acidimicrobiaceae bacterium]MEC7427515.1 histidine phosphatase family protein [Actinomycetota bacterium]
MTTQDETPQQFAQQRWQRTPDATEVILLRHGASQPFVPGQSFPLVDGQGDPPLSPVGVTQAQSSADRLRNEPITALYATNMQRTQQTVAPLAAALGQEVAIEKDLREIGLGEWEGGLLRQKAAENDPTFQRMMLEQRWDVIPGAESNEEFGSRCMNALNRIVERHPGELVLCTVHGGVIGSVLAQIALSRPFAFGGADNCSISQIVQSEGEWLIRRFNDSSHLFPHLHHG